MTWRLAAAFAALLVQACASAPPAPPADPEFPAPPAAELPGVAPAVVPAAAPQPGGTGLVDSAEPLRGVQLVDRGVQLVDRTAAADDLWHRIRGGFAMPELENDLVRKQMAHYAARPDYLQRIFDRSRIYLYHIVEELEKRNLPTELALLPMVESAFNPMAYSRAHASGLWQFIPGTGRRFDLQQNWWYDGRRDIVESTKAALDYLTFLYEMHGDWHLALASYNWGEGAVGRAIAKNRAANRPTDYWSLSMPPETRQ